MPKIIISAVSFLFVVIISFTFAGNTIYGNSIFPLDTSDFPPCQTKSACGYQFWRLFKVNEEVFEGREQALDSLPRSGEFVNCRYENKLEIIREDGTTELKIKNNPSKPKIIWKEDGYNQEAVEEKRFIKSSESGKIPFPENLEDGLYYFCIQNWDDTLLPNNNDPELYVFKSFVYERLKPNLPDNLFVGVPEGSNMVVKDGITYMNTGNIVLGGRFTIGEKPPVSEPQECSFLEQALSNFQFGMKTCTIDGKEGVQQCITNNQNERVWSECITE